LSSDLKRGKRAGWQVNLSSQLDKLTSLSSGTCHLQKKSGRIFSGKIWQISSRESLARRRRCVRDFSVMFLRVLVCLKSVFSDRQNVKYDRDITPHRLLFHGTNSHEHSWPKRVTVMSKKITKWSILTLFWPWAWPDPPPWGGFFRQLAHVILEGSPYKLTWQVDLTSCHLSSDL